MKTKRMTKMIALFVLILCLTGITNIAKATIVNDTHWSVIDSEWQVYDPHETIATSMVEFDFEYGGHFEVALSVAVYDYVMHQQKKTVGFGTTFLFFSSGLGNEYPVHCDTVTIFIEKVIGTENKHAIEPLSSSIEPYSQSLNLQPPSQITEWQTSLSNIMSWSASSIEAGLFVFQIIQPQMNAILAATSVFATVLGYNPESSDRTEADYEIGDTLATTHWTAVSSDFDDHPDNLTQMCFNAIDWRQEDVNEHFAVRIWARFWIHGYNLQGYGLPPQGAYFETERLYLEIFPHSTGGGGRGF